MGSIQRTDEPPRSGATDRMVPSSLDVETLQGVVVSVRAIMDLARSQMGVRITWEYKLVAPKRASWVGEGLKYAEDEFNRLGSEGWELVGFLEHGTSVFRRAKDPL